MKLGIYFECTLLCIYFESALFFVFIYALEHARYFSCVLYNYCTHLQLLHVWLFANAQIKFPILINVSIKYIPYGIFESKTAFFYNFISLKIMAIFTTPKFNGNTQFFVALVTSYTVRNEIY